MRVLVDGVFFQLAKSGIARVWSSCLSRLAAYPEVEITILDRGACPDFAGVRRIPFPSYSARSTADDSFLIEKISDQIGADVFTSTYYTSPVRTPMLLMVYDMIPEALGFDLSARMWQEKTIAIMFARRYLCISHNTKSDLRKFHPHIAENRVDVAHCGVEREIFRPRPRADVDAFRARHHINNRFLMLAGSREQHAGYKNAQLLFRSLRKLNDDSLDIVCVGGEPDIPSEWRAMLPRRTQVLRLDLSDDDMACAYSAASALVYPSLYEGFGLPVAEAMACGCPVITTRYGSLEEVAGSAAEFISGHDEAELVTAIRRVCEPNRRADLTERGLERSTAFCWDRMTQSLYEALESAAACRARPSTQRFFDDWSRLRAIQAAVDTSC